MNNEKPQENSADSIAEEQITAGNNSESNSIEQENTTDDAAEKADEIVEQTASHADEVKLLNEKYLRLYSDFENFRKRTLKERIDLTNTAGEAFFKAILPVLDDFERAKKSMENSTDIAAIKEGVDLVQHKLKNTLQQKGLEEMVSLEQTFDPEIHEAITQFPAPSDNLKGKVVDELEKGYYLNGKVIRFAKVVVGS
ncbi:MAG: nucleotide exchange factor GrpE [Bacteroidota bacterium]